jgi:hypothetical protein
MTSPLRGPNRTITAADAKALYERGCTIRSVAARIERSYGLTHQLLTESGVVLRDRQGRARKAAP